MDLREMERADAEIGAVSNNFDFDDERVKNKLRLVKEVLRKAQNLLKSFLKHGVALDMVSKATVSPNGDSFCVNAQINVSEDGVVKSIDPRHE